jgi:hypothetical protein
MAGNRSTKLVRVPADLADMLSHISELRGVTSGEFIESHIREHAEKAYREIEPIVKRIRRAKASVKKAS